jgi:ketosteroid isomerase-like protein
MACEVGRFTLTILSKGGRSVTDSGKYVVIWKIEGGTWKLHVDIWNK